MLAGLLLLAAVGLVLVGYQATRPPVIIRVAAEAPPAPLTIDILAAAHGLPAGTLVKDEDFTPRTVPVADAAQGALTNSPEIRAGLRGGLLRRYLDAGSILMPSDIMHPRDRGFLATVLAPNTRAVSVGVDAITGNGGLIWPGDRVDLILTQEMTEKDAPPSRHFVAEAILNDVRVVAVDQSFTQGAIVTAETAGSHPARTITLEVTPEQAEQAVVAERLGRISLAIRAADAVEDSADHRPSVYGGDVSAALAESPVRMRVVDGKDDREVTFRKPSTPSPVVAPPQGLANARIQPF
jgi:pilus assembly protein CpaB